MSARSVFRLSNDHINCHICKKEIRSFDSNGYPVYAICVWTVDNNNHLIKSNNIKRIYTCSEECNTNNNMANELFNHTNVLDIPNQ